MSDFFGRPTLPPFYLIAFIEDWNPSFFATLLGGFFFILLSYCIHWGLKPFLIFWSTLVKGSNSSILLHSLRIETFTRSYFHRVIPITLFYLIAFIEDWNLFFIIILVRFFCFFSSILLHSLRIETFSLQYPLHFDVNFLLSYCIHWGLKLYIDRFDKSSRARTSILLHSLRIETCRVSITAPAVTFPLFYLIAFIEDWN